MAYLNELRAQWRPLLASTIGMASGLSIINYVASIMAPQLLQTFGWSRSAFASIGSLGLVSVLFFPFVGRLADMIGVRRTATIGIVTGPLVFLALSAITADIRLYMALFVVQSILCITTTATVYSRTVVQHVVHARGLALAVVASGPALTGMLGAPLLNQFVDAHGWRAGYVAVAVFTAVAGVIALAMLPKDRPGHAPATPRPRTARADYAEILHRPAFRILAASMLLCNLPQVIALTQLKLVLLDNHVTSQGASLMISIFAAGIFAGRFVCGIALDRFPAERVAAISMGLPAIGLYLLATPFDGTATITLAVLLLGLSLGAEGDLVAFLVVRSFGVRLFSSVMGLMTAAISTSASLGAIAVALTLRETGGFTLFLIASATAVLVGSTLLLLLARHREAA